MIIMYDELILRELMNKKIRMLLGEQVGYLLLYLF